MRKGNIDFEFVEAVFEVVVEFLVNLLLFDGEGFETCFDYDGRVLE